MRWEVVGDESVIRIGNSVPQAIAYRFMITATEGVWLMRVNLDNSIDFNREAFPHLTENDFAQRVVTIIEALSRQLPL